MGELRSQLIANNGSVQSLNLPSDMKELYKTVWEIKQRIVLDMAADRGAYIDQSLPEYPYDRRDNGEAVVDALPWLAAGPENWHVLLAHQGCCRCNQVHS